MDPNREEARKSFLEEAHMLGEVVVSPEEITGKYRRHSVSKTLKTCSPVALGLTKDKRKIQCS